MCVSVIGTRAFAAGAGVFVCDTLMLATRAGAGAFGAAPDTPHAVFPRSAGFYVRWQYQRTPRRRVPPTAACIPQNLPRRHLSRLALTGYSRFCGSLALRGFRAAYAVLTPARMVVFDIALPPPEGTAPGGFPLGLLLAGGRQKRERG